MVIGGVHFLSYEQLILWVTASTFFVQTSDRLIQVMLIIETNHHPILKIFTG